MTLPFVRKLSSSREMTSLRTELDGVNKVEDVVIYPPHCDDAPLSLGATLLSGFLRSKARVLVCVFPIALHEGSLCNGPIEEITALRNREEELAATKAGYEVSFLGFGEPFAREGFSTIKDIYDLRRQPRDDKMKYGNHCYPPFAKSSPAAHSLSWRLLRAVGTSTIELFIRPHWNAPQFIPTNGLDFTRIFRIHQSLAILRIIERVPSSLSRPLHPVLVTESIDDKLELLKVYESQLVREQFKQVRRYWERRKGERIWLP